MVSLAYEFDLTRPIPEGTPPLIQPRTRFPLLKRGYEVEPTKSEPSTPQLDARDVGYENEQLSKELIKDSKKLSSVENQINAQNYLGKEETDTGEERVARDVNPWDEVLLNENDIPNFSSEINEVDRNKSKGRAPALPRHTTENRIIQEEPQRKIKKILCTRKRSSPPNELSTAGYDSDESLLSRYSSHLTTTSAKRSDSALLNFSSANFHSNPPVPTIQTSFTRNDFDCDDIDLGSGGMEGYGYTTIGM